jgi:hypothetical protein
MLDGTAFDQLRPPLTVTDPQGLGAAGTGYPKHVHQAGTADDGGPLYLEVRTPDEEAAALSAGWLAVKPDPRAGAGPARPALDAPTHPKRR